jgi:hypothetical protein
MPGPLYRFLADDHVRLERLLQKLTGRQDIVNDTAYAELHAGILRHIAMEEKVLLPFAREKRDGEPLSIAARIRLDHGAIAALLAPTPTSLIIATLQTILKAHNPIEEGSNGLYETVEHLAGPEVDGLLDRIRSVPEVRLAPHSDSSRALESMRQAVERAGYRLESAGLTRPGG